MAIYKYLGGAADGEEAVFKRKYVDLVCAQARAFALQHRTGEHFYSSRKDSSVIVADDVYIFVGWDESINGDVCYWILVDDESTKFAILNTLAANSEMKGRR